MSKQRTKNLIRHLSENYGMGWIVKKAVSGLKFGYFRMKTCVSLSAMIKDGGLNLLVKKKENTLLSGQI